MDDNGQSNNRGLTQKRESFCLNLFEGMSQRDAYIKAGYSSKQSPATIDRHACELAKNDKIQARYVELCQIAEDATVATHLEACQVATEIIRGRFSDFATGANIDVSSEKMQSAALRKVKSKTIYNTAIVTDIELESKLDAIEKLAKLKKWYEADGSVTIDNRVVNISVGSEKAKELTEKLIKGERTE